jgi:hypothetical protein
MFFCVNLENRHTILLFRLILLSYLTWGVFLMQIVPLEAARLFDLNAAILGWLLAAVQPEKAASA